MENRLISELADRLFAAVGGEAGKGAALPVFKYKYDWFDAEKWNSNLRQEEGGEGYDSFLACYDSPDQLLRLKIRFRVYDDFPAIGWTPILETIGLGDTGVIEQFQSVRFSMALPEAPIGECCEMTIRRFLGCKGRPDDFTPANERLTDRFPQNLVELTTDEGAPSASWLPFSIADFDKNHGFSLDIGWPGAWHAAYRMATISPGKSEFSLEAGLPQVRFRLHAGESFQMPTVLFMLRDGQGIRDFMAMRKAFLTQFFCRSQERPTMMCVPGNLSDRQCLEVLAEMKAHPVDVFSIKDGWAGVVGAPLADAHLLPGEIACVDVGSLEVNRNIHADRLEPLFRMAREAGAAGELTISFECVHRESAFAREHSGWMLKSRKSPLYQVLNLGNPEARTDLLSRIKRIVSEETPDHLCLHLTENLLPYWREAEREDRVGATEILYVEGLREVIDTLRRWYPDMLLELDGNRMDFLLGADTVLWHTLNNAAGEFFPSCAGAKKILVDREEL